MRIGSGMATTSFSLGSDFRLGFHLTLNSSSEEGKPFKTASLSPRGSSPGALSVASSPALPTESATNNGHKSQPNERPELAKSLPALAPPPPHQNQTEDPLAQLQNALEKTGFLGRKLLSPPPPMPERQSVEKHPLPLTPPGSVKELELYRCHLCNFSATSKFQYNAHLNSHFDHKCPFCDYTSRTEGRLKRHVKDFHSEAPAENWGNGSVTGGMLSTDDEQTNTPGEPVKPRRHRCKQCEFVALTKSEFWEHSKTHIKAEKLLTCPKCPFVTEYKHHLEYHLRNHFGSKPFKCNKCNYSCVNKSMLNSHMKSHSNVYQYRCADCSYATKYCHSLKLHLRKYGHKPATVLNSDGTLNPFPVIDVYGSRRGPRPKKEMTKQLDSDPRNMDLHPYGGSLLPGPLPPQGGVPFIYPSPHLLSNFNGAMFGVRPPLSPLSAIRPNRGEFPYACSFCEFTTDQQDAYMKHLMSHAANENQDLCSLYGITTETLSNEPQNLNQLAILPPPPPPPSVQNSNLSPTSSPNSEQSSPRMIENNTSSDRQELVEEAVEERSDTTPLDLSHPREQQQQQQSSTRNRRKGKAFKLNRIIRFHEPSFETEDEFMSEDSCTQREDSEDGHPMKDEQTLDGLKMSVAETDAGRESPTPSYQSPEEPKQEEDQSPGHATETGSEAWSEEREAYACHYCDMSFKDCVMYTVHMGYHGYRDPFKCNMCGHESKDKVAFFLHIARAAHL